MRKNMSAMSRSLAEIDPMLKGEVYGYYTGYPECYARTGTLATAPDTEGVFGGGDMVSMKMYMDAGISYSTGRFSGIEVLDATNNGTAGVVGTPGHWDRAEKKSKQIVDSNYSAEFG